MAEENAKDVHYIDQDSEAMDENRFKTLLMHDIPRTDSWKVFL